MLNKILNLGLIFGLSLIPTLSLYGEPHSSQSLVYRLELRPTDPNLSFYSAQDLEMFACWSSDQQECQQIKVPLDLIFKDMGLIGQSFLEKNNQNLGKAFSHTLPFLGAGLGFNLMAWIVSHHLMQPSHEIRFPYPEDRLSFLIQDWDQNLDSLIEPSFKEQMTSLLNEVKEELSFLKKQRLYLKSLPSSQIIMNNLKGLNFNFEMTKQKLIQNLNIQDIDFFKKEWFNENISLYVNKGLDPKKAPQLFELRSKIVWSSLGLSLLTLWAIHGFIQNAPHQSPRAQMTLKGFRGNPLHDFTTCFFSLYIEDLYSSPQKQENKDPSFIIPRVSPTFIKKFNQLALPIPWTGSLNVDNPVKIYPLWFKKILFEKKKDLLKQEYLTQR